MKRSKKIKVTSDNFNDLLVESSKELVQFKKGNISLKQKIIDIPAAPPSFTKEVVRKIRKSIDLTQSAFANVVGVTASAVKNWEQGSKRPSSAARRVLQMLNNDPKTTFMLIAGNGKKKR
ncbi:MAG: helix-turn-helix domain-containing protein [Oligoflexia bacterium]|nr:helix-turn-helix domain-containing protein [Oligoflexia bacterium]